MSNREVEWPEFPRDLLTEEFMMSIIKGFVRDRVKNAVRFPKADEIRGSFSERLGLTDAQDRVLCVFMIQVISAGLQEHALELEREVHRPMKPPKKGAPPKKKQAIGFFIGN